MNRLKPHAEGTLHKKLVYIRNNWQLYVFFMLPALALTIVFKYLPMGGLAIAFQDYNNRKGIWGSDFIGFAHFMRFLSSPDFITLMANTLKLSIYGLLWGFFPPVILAIIMSRIRSRNQEKHSASHLCTQLHLRHCYVRYDYHLPFSGRSGQSAAGHFK